MLECLQGRAAVGRSSPADFSQVAALCYALMTDAMYTGFKNWPRFKRRVLQKFELGEKNFQKIKCSWHIYLQFLYGALDLILIIFASIAH